MSDYLPQEVWVRIFTRLPIKSLVRIRSVCKFFDSIITSPCFISDHIAVTKQNCSPVISYLKGREISKRKEQYLVLPNDLKRKQELDFPFKSKCCKHFQIVGSCNGVFCLSDNEQEYDYSRGPCACGIILWNPSIKRYVSLPKPRVTLRSHEPYKLKCVIGFGFDCQTGDHKVVRIMFVNGCVNVKGWDAIPPAPDPQVEIYTVKSRSWKNVNVGTLPYRMWKVSQAFVEGSAHWPGYISSPDYITNGRSLIVCFDMKNDVFREVNLTDYLKKNGSHLHLKVLGEKLAVVENDSRVTEIYAVWVMEEHGKVESWRKMYNVDLSPRGYFTFLGFRNNGDIIGTIARNKLVLYDPNYDSLKNLGVSGCMDSFDMATYMESLVLLDGESAISQSEAITCEGYYDW